jgi:tRNA A37 methylthiotransferase MiaB
VRRLAGAGYREVVLLGQNVNSYFDGKAMSRRQLARARAAEQQQQQHQEEPEAAAPATTTSIAYQAAPGFRNTYNLRDGEGARFAELLSRVAEIDPEMRVRFTSPHPKDFPDAVLDVIAAHPNICRGIHMPAQSGSNRMLEKMRRGHTRDAYLDLVARFRAKVPGVEFSSDFISGFCGESEADHADTLDLLRQVEYEHAFMFAYSMRERTHAWHRMEDDVPEAVKKRRLAEVVQTFRETALARSAAAEGAPGGGGRVKLCLVEGASRRSTEERPQMTGRTDTHRRSVFAHTAAADFETWRAGGHSAAAGGGGRGGGRSGSGEVALQTGDYVAVLCEQAAVTTLHGTPLFRTSLREFDRLQRTGLL